MPPFVLRGGGSEWRNNRIYCVNHTNLYPFYRYLSKVLGNRFDHCAEMLLPTLIVLIQNSAKIMASSGLVALTLIIQVG